MLEKIPSIVGKALQGVRPGLEATVVRTAFADRPETITVGSSAFENGGTLPRDCTEDGGSKGSPPVAWRNAPDGTVEVVLIVEDADSPTPNPLVHAILYGLPSEGAIETGGFGMLGNYGEASMGQKAWLPPDPPSGHGPHRYVVQVFALSEPSGLTDRPGRSATVDALNGKVMATGVLIGTYERS